MIHPAGNELECAEAVDADEGAIAAIGDELDLGAVGVITQPRLGDRRPCGVAGDAQQRLAVLARDFRRGRRSVGPDPVNGIVRRD